MYEEFVCMVLTLVVSVTSAYVLFCIHIVALPVPSTSGSNSIYKL